MVNSHEDQSPVSLEEIERKFLSEEQIKQRRVITVEEEQDVWRERHQAIRQSIEDRFRRNTTKLVLTLIVVFLTVPIILPDRYDMIVKLTNLLLAATSGFVLGRMSNNQDSQKK